NIRVVSRGDDFTITRLSPRFDIRITGAASQDENRLSRARSSALNPWLLRLSSSLLSREMGIRTFWEAQYALFQVYGRNRGQSTALLCQVRIAVTLAMFRL